MNLHEIKTLSELLHRCADVYRLELAVGEWTYGELEAHVCARAHELRAEHRVGTPLVLDLPAGSAWVVEFFAILEAGLVVAPLLPGMPRDRVEQLLGSSAPAGTALLLCTSVARTRPLVVRLTHANLMANLVALHGVRCVRPGEAILSVLPPAHLFELMCGVLGPMSCGAYLAHQGVPTPDRVLRRLRDTNSRSVLLVPALFEMVARLLADDDARDPRAIAARLRRIPDPEQAARRARRLMGDRFENFVVGGAALHPAWADVAQRLGFGLEVGYGLTEAGPIVSIGDATRLPPGSCGRPLPGVEVAIAADGAVLVRASSVMAGYHRDPDATSAALRDGWLHTGDRGRIDDAGHLYIEGRLKDAIVPSTGETIWPEEIEEHYASDLFADFCVGARPGPAGNDSAVLYVVPAIADPDALAGEFRRLRRAAPERARVKQMRVVDGPLPRTDTGELRRRELARDRERELRRLIEDAIDESLAPYSIDDDLMAELCIDSLAALRVLALVEQRFRIRLPDDRLGEFRTLRRLLDGIELLAGKEMVSCVSA